MPVVVNNNPDLGSLMNGLSLDENNIVTIHETEDDTEAASSSSRASQLSQFSQGREERDRRGRNGRRVRVRPRRYRYEESEGPVSPKQVPMKNAVMMLNEMFPPPGAPQYKVISMTGTPNNPTFTMTCTIGENSFSGTGRSKKEAKLAASQLVLQEMFGKDFSGGNEADDGGQGSSPAPEPEMRDWLELEGKNPVSILNELYPGVMFCLVSAEGPSHAPVYRVRASLASLSYEGLGASKKEAKLHASKSLLAEIHRVGFDPITGGLKCPNQNNNNSQVEESHRWPDKVSRLVREQYDKLFDGTTYHKRKVLAGVVMDNAGVSSVICLSTGTKCINGEMMSLTGQTLNDCHAEVVVRRCLMSWLYDQLETAVSGHSEVLERRQGSAGYYLRPAVTLHLFISTAPCGDARIFSLHEQPAVGSNVLTSAPGKLGEGNRGKLRTKIESGMGTVPLPETETIQTWDGVFSGERLKTMACSDKILSWNVTGCQGSLLSHWLHPVHFTTISIGSKFHPEHVARAVHGRVGPDFRLNRPPLLATTSPETRQPGKAQDHSLNWVLGSQPEVVMAASGRNSEGKSRLCKKSLAERFMKVCSLPAGIKSAKTDLANLSLTQICNLRYDEVKSLAVENMRAKQCLKEKLVLEGCGRWVVKPVEQDQFLMREHH